MNRNTYSKGWFKFLEQVEEAKEELSFQENEECFYRGLSRCEYTLTPGLFRNIGRNTQAITEKLWTAESDMFYEFRSRAKDIHNQSFADWDILFAMQHHGVKTRLLDWTENLCVAIYFALLNYNETTSPCIWLLNPYKLNETYMGDRDLVDPVNLGYDSDEEEFYTYVDYLLDEDYKNTYDWNVPVAIYPIRLDNRLTSQGGYFTIHGNDIRPLEDIVPIQDNILKRMCIPKEEIPSAYLFLQHAGVNHFSLFPDLDGLATYLNAKYRC